MARQSHRPSRRRPGRTRLAAGALAAGAAFAAAAGADAEPAARRHPVLLWSYDDDAARPGFAAALRSIGATGLQCPSYRDPGPWRALGLDWYEDHATGKGTLGLRGEEWSPAWQKVWEARFDPWPPNAVRARPRCLRDRAVVEAMETRLRPVAERARTGASFVVLEDEASSGVLVRPLDWCLCDRCTGFFRAWAKERWRELAALNAAWGTRYASWDDVRPWTTQAIRERELRRDPGAWNLAPWMETRAFQDRSFAATVHALADLSRSVAPDVPVGLAGTQAPSAFGGYDYALLVRGQTFVEPYDIGLALPVSRDLAAPGATLAQTVFPNDASERAPRWLLWRGVARGANATVVWSSRDALRFDAKRGTWSATPYGRSIADDLRRLGAADGIGARLAATEPAYGDVWIVHSQPSIRVRWMLDSAPDGAAWLNRFGSYEAVASNAIRARETAWRALAQRSPRFVDVARLDAKDAEIPAGTVVVLPDVVALGDAAAARLAAFAKAGGLVVADRAPNVYDEIGRARARPGIAGVVVDEGFATLATKVAERVGSPALRVRASRADGDAAPPVEVGLRRGGGRVYAVCVPQWTSSGSGDGSTDTEVPDTRLTLEFTTPVPRAVRDEWSGRDLGEVRTWAATTDAASPTVWSWPESP